MGRSKGNGAASPLPAAEKKLTRGTFFVVELGQLPADQRAEIEAAAGTPAKMRELYRIADRAGDPSPGTDIRAIRVGQSWLVFHEKADEIELAQLIPDSTFRQMGVRLTPAGGGRGEVVARP